MLNQENRGKMFISGNNNKMFTKTILKYLSNNFFNNYNKDFSCIDIGCGDLEFCKTIKKYTKGEISGIDLYCNKQKGIITYTRDLDKDWNISKRYDLVVSMDTIEHVENPYHFFREISKLVKDNGIIVICTNNINYYYSKLMFLFLNHHLGFWWNKDNKRDCQSLHLNDQWHKSPMNKEEFMYISKMCGFDVIDYFFDDGRIKLFPFIKPIYFNVNNELLCTEMFFILKKRKYEEGCQLC